MHFYIIHVSGFINLWRVDGEADWMDPETEWCLEETGGAADLCQSEEK